MQTSRATERRYDTGSLFIAFVVTAALVGGVAGGAVVVDALHAGVPPALRAIVLPATPAEVASAPPPAPPQPEPAPARATIAAAPARPATASTATSSPARTSTARPVVGLVTAPIAVVTASAPLATATDPVRSTAGIDDDRPIHAEPQIKDPRDPRDPKDAKDPREPKDPKDSKGSAAHRGKSEHANGGRRAGR